MSPGARAAARVVTIALPAAGAMWGLTAPDSLLWGATAWLGFLIAALAGWGHLAARALRTDVALDLRLAWGTAALLAVAGWLLAFGMCDRRALLVLLAIGYGGYAWRHVVEPEPALAGVWRGLAGLRRDPQAAILWAVLAALAGFTVLGAVARLRGNHFDDDIAYTPMVKRLLQTGDLDEPFSFRRLSAMGGQTILQALGAARGNLGNLFLVDHGLFRIVTLALVIGLFRRQGPADRFVAGAVLLMLILLPDASINAVSYWSGAALFLAMYRTTLEVDRMRGGFVALGGLTAAVCCLRQNYLPVALLFPFLFLLLRLRRPLAASWRAERGAWIAVIGAGAVALVPYLVASWRELHTVLYPLQIGTGNPQIATTRAAWSWWQEVQWLIRVSLDPNPIRVMVPLLPVLLLCRDRRRGVPLLALTVACAVGYVFLVHAFAVSDSRNMWRYAFGYMTVLATVVIIEVAGRGLSPRPSGDTDDAPVRSSLAARVIVLVCLLAQFSYSLRSSMSNYKDMALELGEAHRNRPATSQAIAALYGRLQASVPAGAPLVVLLDEPAYLDFTRNRIFNLDTPGFASLPPGMPMFTSAEAKADYLRGRGLRYLAFVRGDHSAYFYRRDYWVERVFWDDELWSKVASYELDLIDSFAELATRHRVIFDEGGLVVLELPAGAPDAAALALARPVADEPAARFAFVKALATREGLLAPWTLMSRGDFVFEEGWSRNMRVARDENGVWQQVPRTTQLDRGVMARFVNRTAHARVRGAADMQVVIRGHIEVGAIYTRPRVSLTIAGHELASHLVEPDGAFEVTAIVPAGWLGDWADLYLHLSSVGEPWRDAAVTKVARVEQVDWEPVPR